MLLCGSFENSYNWVVFLRSTDYINDQRNLENEWRERERYSEAEKERERDMQTETMVLLSLEDF